MVDLSSPLPVIPPLTLCLPVQLSGVPHPAQASCPSLGPPLGPSLGPAPANNSASRSNYPLTQLSPAIILMSGGAHDGGLLQS